MPIVTIQIRRDILTDDEKVRLAHDIIGLLLDADPEINTLDINIVFQEIEKHGWWVRRRDEDVEDEQTENQPDMEPSVGDQPKVTFCTSEL